MVGWLYGSTPPVSPTLTHVAAPARRYAAMNKNRPQKPAGGWRISIVVQDRTSAAVLVKSESADGRVNRFRKYIRMTLKSGDWQRGMLTDLSPCEAPVSILSPTSLGAQTERRGGAGPMGATDLFAGFARPR